MIPAKPVYLNGVRIADASTWFEVAEIVSKATGLNFTGKSIQRYGSEGPGGFYVTVTKPRAPFREVP